VPLSLAVGFAMIASFLLSSSLLPVLSVWWLGKRPDQQAHSSHRADWVERLRDRLAAFLERLAPVRGLRGRGLSPRHVAVLATAAVTLGREIFPPSGVKAFQLRFRAPAGTKFEATERLGRDVLDTIRGASRRPIVSTSHWDMFGVQPSSYPINTIFLWTGGAHEGVLQVALRPDAPPLEVIQEKTPARLSPTLPEAQFSFEPGDIVSRIMNFSAPTPMEIAVMGPDFAASRSFARKLQDELAGIASLRDLQYGQTLDYPAIQVDVDRQMAGQLGVTVDEVGRSFAAATSSSRFVAPNYWSDPRTGIAFQVQVQVPQPRMQTLEDLRVVPVSSEGSAQALLGDLARIENTTIVGEYDRINGQRMITLTANVAGEDLGRALTHVNAAVQRAGTPPRGTTDAIRGQLAAMQETFR
jgi:multidrug efflux pump subunit AcrB